MPQDKFDFIVTVCDADKEACPYFPGGKIVLVGFQDPPRLTQGMTDEAQIMDVYSRVRDEIREFVQRLPEWIGDPQ